MNEVPHTTRPLSTDQIAGFHRDGFVIITGFFDREEIEPIRRFCEQGTQLQRLQTVVDVGAGKSFKVASWTDLDDTLFGSIPRMARVVDAVEALLGRECYHWHSKLLRKTPNDGKVGIHQDFATWYEDGCLFPHLLTCTIAIDRNDRENGCLQVVPGSNAMARIHRVQLGDSIDTHGPDPVRVEKAVEKLGITHCELDPGDVLFFHCNTLHCSGPNHSKRSRTVIHCSYNAVSNQPITRKQEHHCYRPLKKLPDNIIKEEQYSSVYSQHTFHPPETADGPGVGIFFRKSDDDVAAKPTKPPL